MAVVDANIFFSESEINDMKEAISIDTEIKKLKSKQEVLKERIKKTMISKGHNAVDVDGEVITVTESTRKTVTKATKDEFVSQLIGLKKQHLLITSIEPDVDSIFAEVDSGALSKDLVDKYIKVTPVTTLKL